MSSKPMTKAQILEARLDLFCKAFKFKRAKAWNDVGGLLIHHGAMGGVNVGQVVNAGGGISEPFASGFFKPAELGTLLLFAARAADFKKNK